MNKEEILKKAQSRKPNQMDEMEMDIFQKSSYIGMTVGLIMCVVLMIINIYCNGIRKILSGELTGEPYYHMAGDGSSVEFEIGGIVYDRKRMN